MDDFQLNRIRFKEIANEKKKRFCEETLDLENNDFQIINTKCYRKEKSIKYTAAKETQYDLYNMNSHAIIFRVKHYTLLTRDIAYHRLYCPAWGNPGSIL